MTLRDLRALVERAKISAKASREVVDLALPLLDVVEAAEAAYKAPDALAVRVVLGPALAALRRATGERDGA